MEELSSPSNDGKRRREVIEKYWEEIWRTSADDDEIKVRRLLYYYQYCMMFENQDSDIPYESRKQEILEAVKIVPEMKHIDHYMFNILFTEEKPEQFFDQKANHANNPERT